MRIAFYAPLKSPTHGVPSGDRRVAGLLMQALAAAGHRVELASTFRSYDREGDPARQAALREQGLALAARLAAQWREGPEEARPALWFTYHLYYKAPDWLGPAVSRALGIPYVVAEASDAPKRAGGPWHLNHEGARAAVAVADLLLCPTRDDLAGLLALGLAPGKVVHFPPFLDAATFPSASEARPVQRAALAARHGLPAGVPWIAVAAMMRPGDKAASYRALSLALAELRDLDWRLLVAGDGEARGDIEQGLQAAVPGRTAFLGALGQEEVAMLYTACDLCAWPAVNEAYGMAMLEAQAAGLPVLSSATRGVPDVVEDGRTGLLAPAGDVPAFAALLRTLIQDRALRERLGRSAAIFARGERSLEAAAARMRACLAPFDRTSAGVAG